MIGWILDHQQRIHFVLCLASIALIAAVGDYRWPQVVVAVVVSMLLVFLGQRLHRGETTENWLSAGYGEMLKSVLGGALTVIGWLLLMRGGVGRAIGAAILKMG